MKKLQNNIELIKRLKALLISQRLLGFCSGLLSSLALIATIAVILSLLANFVVLPVWLKISLLGLSALASIYTFVRFALGRIKKGSIDQVAVTLEKRFPELKGRLIAAVQFSRQSFPEGSSLELVEQTQEQALRRASEIEFNKVSIDSIGGPS